LQLFCAAATATQFKATRKEMNVAQGVMCRNDTWDAAVAQMTSKAAGVAEWCEVAATASSDDGEMEPLSLSHDGEEDIDMLPRGALTRPVKSDTERVMGSAESTSMQGSSLKFTDGRFGVK
jgi:hypothetical protein